MARKKKQYDSDEFNYRLLARNLMSIRVQKGVSQAELSSVLGVVPQMVSDYEKGKSVPGLPVLCRYGDYFNVSVDYLIGRDKIEIEKEKEVVPIADVEMKLLEGYRRRTAEQKRAIRMLCYGGSALKTLNKEIEAQEEHLEYLQSLRQND